MYSEKHFTHSDRIRIWDINDNKIENEKDYRDSTKIDQGQKAIEFQPLTWHFNTMTGVTITQIIFVHIGWVGTIWWPMTLWDEGLSPYFLCG